MPAVVVLLFLLLSFQTPAWGDSGRILYRPAQTFRGWGMSLAWEANDLYGGGRQSSRIKDPQIQGQYLDLLFGDPAARPTLGFTVARYNIGGGDDPSHAHMRPDAQMEGFQASPGAAFDWSRDAPQRRMLHEAKARGANIFEAFSVGPPYWMTFSGCSSGAQAAHPDNLRPEMRESFADYLVTVVRHFRQEEGITFESLEAFNEPDLGWGAGGRQEGYSAPEATRDVLIPLLADRLKRDGEKTIVAGIDTNNVDSALSSLDQLSPAARSALVRLNTHDYHANNNRARLRQYRSRVRALGKPVWMTELGCCFPGQGDKTDIWGALFLADSVRADLRDMGAEAWILWQPDWNVIDFDTQGGAPHPRKQFYALLQYTRFIRPGFQVISAGGAYNTLAAYSSSMKRLVLVSTNWGTAASNELDLSGFGPLPTSVPVYRTTADEAANLQESSIALSIDSHLIDGLPVRSITTYVVDGVLPLTTPSPRDVEGTHGIVSEATGLCWTNTTRSGESIVPYPCDGFGSQIFNFIDRKDGYYAVQTLNGAEGATGLCLNIARAATSPGDGKAAGGPGNMIQWNCAGRPAFDNELFKIVDEGEGRVRFQVKNSGLCLEDPGRGGTIRQNLCSVSNRNQRFSLDN